MVNKKLDLSLLNKNQYEAVTTIDGSIQLCSVAGSGKTRVLTYRTAYMIKKLNINPSKIFVSTFTKKAATEMTKRLEKLLTKKEIKELTIGTFHSIGYHILKDYYRSINSPMKNFQLLSGAPIKWMMSKILKDLNIEISDTYNEETFIGAINKLKMQLISPEQYVMNVLTGDASKHERNVLNVYDEYEKRKENERKIDFNDMLYKVYFLFLTNEEILNKYQNKFEYLLIDEAQDNNKAQYELIKMLAKPHNNVFIVGDDDQSIYGFRGAQPSEFINFKENFSSTQRIDLDLNYRSLPYILEAANKVIKHNDERVVKELKPFRKQQENKKAQYIKFENEDFEAKYVAEKIAEMEKENKNLNDISILYRTNAQARALEDHLVLNGIPYQIFNGISFYERSEIKDVISYLKLIINHNDNESFERIINKPSRYLGRKFLSTLNYIADQRGICLYEALDYINKVNYGQRKNIKQFKKDIEFLKNRINANDIDNVGDALGVIVSMIKYDKYLIEQNGNEEDNNKLENVRSLISAGQRYKKPEDFLKYINIVNSAKYDSKAKTVKLMTIHKAKGLEFPIVFVVGMSEGLLPHKYAILEEKDNQNKKGIQEERRLTYVALTRAEDILIATSPSFYQGKSLSKSRFLNEGEFEKLEVN